LPQIFLESTVAFFHFSAARRASGSDPTSIGVAPLSKAEKRITFYLERIPWQRLKCFARTHKGVFFSADEGPAEKGLSRIAHQ
jgi:hypothetical protein